MSTEVSSEADVLSENDETEIQQFIKTADKNLAELKFKAPEDDVSKYVNEYLEKEMYKGNGPIPKVDNDSSDDLESVIEDSKAEETYNFRFEEKGADKIMTHPRRVAGEQRENISARKRKRMEAKKKKDEDNENFNKEMDEVDEKWHQIYIKNGNKFSNEELTQYNNEVADVITKYQGGEFKYVEVPKEGDIAKSIKIIEEEDEEEEDNQIELPEEDELEIHDKKNADKILAKAEEKLKRLENGEDVEEEESADEEEDKKEGEEKGAEGKKKHRGKRGKHRAGAGRRDRKGPFRGRGGFRGKPRPKDRASTYQLH